MFDLIAQGMQAYNQIGLFIGALICFGLGGLLLGSSLYWRVHALRASGTVIGVIARNGTYVAVYRYALPDGQTHEAKSDTGSSSVRGKETGRVVPLLISAHNPTAAREANSHLFDIIGAVLIAPGLWLAYTALTAYKVTPMTWIMAVAMLVYMAERAYRIFIPRGQRLSIEEWKRQHGTDGSAIDMTQVKPIETLVSVADVAQAQQTQWQNTRKAAPFLGFFAVVLVCIGIYQSIRIARLEASGLRAQGQVVRMKEESSSGSGYTYHAIVRFRTEKNVTVEFKDDVGSNPPGHRPGDKVNVLYLADRPRQEAIIDRGRVWNWMTPGIVFSCAVLVVGLMIGLGRQRPVQNA